MNIIKKTLVFFCTIWSCLAGYGQVTADFSAPVTEACNTLQVSFTDWSESLDGNIIAWQWNLGGTMANKQNPSIIFNQAGSYDICLIVTDDNGAMDTLCKEGYITIYNNPVANFLVDPADGCSPLVSSYTNTSSSPNGNITELIWDVGGSTNLIILQDQDSVVSSTYVLEGSYSASLFIKDEKGCEATIVKPIATTVLPKPVLDFDHSVISGCSLPWEVQFNNNNPDPETNYSWTFGNGETFDGSSPPIIIYDTTGLYDIEVSLERLGCVDTIRSIGLINPGGPADFAIEPNGACVDTPLKFYDVSQITADSIFWDFGDGISVIANEPIHIYASDGCFEVMMIRYSAECIDTVVKPCVQINPLPQINTSISNQYACSLPATLQLNAESDLIGEFQWTFKGLDADRVLYGDTVSILMNEYGDFLVDLEFTSELGCVVAQTDLPVSLVGLEAQLPLNGPRGCAPLEVSLVDSVISEVQIINWEWTITNTDDISNPIMIELNGSDPTFTLSDTGRYDVQLIVENVLGCLDTIVIEDYIWVGNPPIVDFVATPLEECILAPKTFTALTSDNADSWVWGTDGTDTLSLDQNPVMYLSSAKLWDISLTAYHNGCPNTLIKPGYINILEPASNYSIDYNCDDPYTIDINNNITGADSLYWVIEVAPNQLDTFFNQTITSFTFPQRGKYFINNYSVNFTTGCEHYRSDTILISDPVSSFELDTIRGCVPLDIKITGSSIDAIHNNYILLGATIDSSLSVINPNLKYSTPGVYQGPTLIITDIHGCQDTMTISDSIRVNGIEAAAAFINGTCIPGEIELIDISNDSLVKITDRKWYAQGVYISSDSIYSLSVDNAGYIDLSLAVIDEWGCEDSIFQKQAIYGSDIQPEFFTIDSNTCVGHNIKFQLKTSQSEIANYLWDFGDGTTSTLSSPMHTYSAEGNYTVCVTISNNRSCERYLCKENYINIVNPVASFTGNPLYETCPPLLTSFSNSSLNANEYVWNFGDNSGESFVENPSHIYNEPGLFTVRLVASSSPYCSDTLIITDYVTVDGPSGSFTMVTDSACLPLMMTIIAQADDLYTFSYDYGNGETSISDEVRMMDTVTYIYDEIGSYVPKLILTDGSGCIRSFTSDEIVVNDLALDFNTDQQISCALPINIALNNMSNSSSDDISYTWIISGNEDITIPNMNADFDLSLSGSYQVSLIGSADNCIDTLTIDSLLQIATTPIVDFTVDASQACEQVALLFENNTSNEYGEIVSYLWDFGDGSESNNVEPIHIYENPSDFNVTLTVVTEFGCVASAVVPVYVLDNLVPVLPDDYTMCIGDSIQILVQTVGSGDATVNYSWTMSESLTCDDCSFPYANPADTTTYILNAEYSNGCTSSDTMTVNVVPILGPSLELSMDTIICHQDTARIFISNFNNALQYTWDYDPSIDCFSCEQIDVYPEFGTHYAVTVKNEYGCFKKDSIYVAVERGVDDFLVNSKGICENASTLLSVSNPEMLNPSWSDGNDILCSDCFEVEVLPSNNQYYYLNADSPLGCSYTDSIYIIIVPEESIVMGDDQLICVGEEALLTSQGYGTPYWTPIENNLTPNKMSTIVSPIVPTVYTVSYILDECVRTDTVLVDVIDKVDIQVLGDTICIDEIATLSVTGVVDNYTWYNGNDKLGMTDMVDFQTNTDAILSVIGKYGLCEDDTAYAQVFVQPEINYEIIQNDYTLYINSAERVIASFDDDSYLYEWTPAEGLSCADCPDPKISDIGRAMNYIVIVTDPITGCSIEDVISVKFFNRCSEKAFYIPNIFSPNGDGANDRFYVSAEDPEEFDYIRIYDRWGSMLFSSDDINESWDGHYHGQPLMSGVYPYRVDYTCLDTGESFVFYGDVTIIR